MPQIKKISTVLFCLSTIPFLMGSPAVQSETTNDSTFGVGSESFRLSSRPTRKQKVDAEASHQLKTLRDQTQAGYQSDIQDWGTQFLSLEIDHDRVHLLKQFVSNHYLGSDYLKLALWAVSLVRTEQGIEEIQQSDIIRRLLSSLRTEFFQKTFQLGWSHNQYELLLTHFMSSTDEQLKERVFNYLYRSGAMDWIKALHGLKNPHTLTYVFEMLVAEVDSRGRFSEGQILSSVWWKIIEGNLKAASIGTLAVKGLEKHILEGLGLASGLEFAPILDLKFFILGHIPSGVSGKNQRVLEELAKGDDPFVRLLALRALGRRLSYDHNDWQKRSLEAFDLSRARMIELYNQQKTKAAMRPQLIQGIGLEFEFKKQLLTMWIESGAHLSVEVESAIVHELFDLDTVENGRAQFVLGLLHRSERAADDPLVLRTAKFLMSEIKSWSSRVQMSGIEPSLEMLEGVRNLWDLVIRKQITDVKLLTDVRIQTLDTVMQPRIGLDLQRIRNLRDWIQKHAPLPVTPTTRTPSCDNILRGPWTPPGRNK